MTTKRYTKMMNHYGTSRTYCTGIYDNQNNRELQNSNQVITELNTLSDENEQLKKQDKINEDCYKKLLQKYDDLKKENEQLKQVLGSILIEVRRDISATNHSGEVKAFVNPNSFDLISDVLKKYGALKEWYE